MRTPEETKRLKRGLEGLFKMDRLRLCEMVEEYARAQSIHDLRECWEEVLETLDALIWLEEMINEKKNEAKHDLRECWEEVLETLDEAKRKLDEELGRR